MIAPILAALVAAAPADRSAAPDVAPAAGAAKTSHLVVEAEGFEDSTGVAVLRLLGPSDHLGPGSGGRRFTAAIHQGHARFDLGAIAAGRWAVVVFHDMNRNGTLDHSVLRLPAEPLGFSGSYRIGLLSGRPTFDKLAVELAPGPQGMVIHVR